MSLLKAGCIDMVADNTNRELTPEELSRIKNIRDAIDAFPSHVNANDEEKEFLRDHFFTITQIYFDAFRQHADGKQTTQELTKALAESKHTVGDLLCKAFDSPSERADSTLFRMQGIYYRFADEFLQSILSVSQQRTR